MEKIFLVYNDLEITYGKLLSDINAKRDFTPYVHVNGNNPYEIFLRIVHSLIYDYSIEVLDGDFSEREFKELGIDTNALSILRTVDIQQQVDDFKTLIEKVKNSQSWTLTLYTSGTTGRPKKVSHNLSSLTRNVKLHPKFEENIWAFAYNPTHMAGLQVFFQAFMNHNTIVYTFDDQKKLLPQLIKKYKITNISATSTFYRNALTYLRDEKYESIKRITFGGEKYDPNMENIIKSIFPNAKVRNIYASTEAGSLFVAKGDIFEIPENIIRFVNIESNELLIHRRLLGQSESFSLVDDWFKTGDIIERVDNFHFKFKSRQSDIINVGGYKVNPIEVENTLIRVPGVVDLLVKPKENRVTGQILVVDVVKDERFGDMELKKSIKKFAGEQLQEWKIPRIINFVEEIPRNRAGKKVRWWNG